MQEQFFTKRKTLGVPEDMPEIRMSSRRLLKSYDIVPVGSIQTAEFTFERIHLKISERKRATEASYTKTIHGPSIVARRNEQTHPGLNTDCLEIAYYSIALRNRKIEK